jgi:hypothetical protein
MSCTTTGTPISFSYAEWSTLFPELASSVSQPQAQTYFNVVTATLIDNGGNGPVPNTGAGGTLDTLLNFATAHVAALFASIGGQPSSTLVGRVSDASQGSVSVGTDMPALPMAAAYWTQTKYGLMAWQMMAPYRTVRYVPAPRRAMHGLGRGWY